MSPAPVRRPATSKPPVEKIRFLDNDTYSGGNFDLPEGRYCMYFDFLLHAYTKQDGSKGKEFLALHLLCHNLDQLGADPIDHYLSMGKKAMESVLPNVDDGGKSLVAIPGGSGKLGRNSNAYIFLRSLVDAAGNPPELADVTDLTQIDGVWVVTKNVLEPEERKSYSNRQSTGEVEEERRNTEPQKIPNVVEIIEGGVPWEGTGGLPEDTAPAPKPAKTTPVSKPQAPSKPAPRPVKKVEPEPEPEEGDAEDMNAAVQAAITEVLSNAKFAKGTTRVTLRMEAFKAIKSIAGEDGQQALATMFEDSPDTIESMLGELGYEVKAGKVVPA